MTTTTQLTIQDFIADSYEEAPVLKRNLQLSGPRFSQLKRSGTPALPLAQLVYKLYGEVLYPFSTYAVSENNCYTEPVNTDHIEQE